MKLGKGHLVVSLVMVAASLAYNIWVFTRPAKRSAQIANAAPLVDGAQFPGPVVTGDQTAAPQTAAIDPATLPPPPDVDLARPPEWPRNPFASAWLRQPETIITPVAAIDIEPEVALASILHSPERRLAVVNGRIVRAGDRVGSSTILEIQARAIVVESSKGARRVVELHAARTAASVARASAAAKTEPR